METKLDKIEICKDVIARIKAGRIVPTSMYFPVCPRDNTIDAKSYIQDKVCEVCAKGALLVSVLDRKNSLNLYDASCLGWKPLALAKYLEVFSYYELQEIESVFEITLDGNEGPSNWVNWLNDWCDESDFEPDVSEWPESGCFDREKWLIWIMENIIENGSFDMEQFCVDHHPSQMVKPTTATE